MRASAWVAVREMVSGSAARIGLGLGAAQEIIRGMKKALPIILLLAALAAAIAIFLKRKGGNLDMPPGLAAELAPAETILFLEIPDPARTKERWKETNLYKLSQEPEWKEFVGKWDEFIGDDAVF